MTSTEAGTLHLDADLQIQRATSLPAWIRGELKPGESGRQLKHHLNYEKVEQDARWVLRTEATVEREVGSHGEQRYRIRMSPRRAGEGNVDGVEVTIYPAETGLAVYFRDMTERKEAERELKRRAKLDAFRVELADAIRPLSDPVEIQRQAARILGQRLDVGSAHYAEFDEDEDTFRIHAGYYPDDTSSSVGEHHLSHYGDYVVATLRAGENLVVDDVDTHPELTEEERAAHVEIGTRADVSVPLVKEDRLKAVFSVDNAEPRAWTDAEVEMIEETAERTWAAVERARAEQALRESEARLDAFVTTTSEVVYRMSPDWSEMNSLKGQESRRDTNESLEIWLAEYIPEEERSRVRSVVEQAIETESMFELEHKIVRTDGTLGWRHSRAVPIRDDNGEIVEWFATATDITERKQLERELRAEKERLDVAVENSPLTIWQMDTDFRYIWIKHLPPEFEVADVLGRRADEVLPPEAAETAREPKQRAMKTGKRVREEVAYTLPNGEEVAYDLTAVPLRDESGEIEGLTCAAFEITERKEAEQALRESEARLNAVLEQLPVGVGMIDPEGEWVFTNLLFDEYVTVETLPSEVSSEHRRWQTWTEEGDRVAPENWPGARALRGETVSPGMDFLYTPSEGQARWLRVSAAPFFGPDEEDIQGAVTVVQDIHERKRAQEELRQLNEILENRVEKRTRELRQSEEQFRALVEASAQMAWRTNAEGQVVEDSPSWRAFTGQSLDGWMGRGGFEAVHPEDRAQARRRWSEAVESETPLENEFRVYHAESETYRWTQVRAVPLYDDDENVLGWVGMSIDIDERKRANAELEALTEELEERVQKRTSQVRELSSKLTMAEQRERRRLARVLHDDLQQRLCSVQMRLGLLRQNTDDASLRDQIQKVDALVDESITTTRQLTVDLSPPVLESEGLLEALYWLQTQMEDLHGLEFALETNRDRTPVLQEDMRVLLFQAVRELLFNVVKHAGVSHATVILDGTDDELVVVVADDGKGFDPDALSGEEYEASFGLTSVRERIGLFGGDFSIESSPGDGTRVTIRTPLRTSPN